MKIFCYAVLLCALFSASCASSDSTHRIQREFPPRVDKYLASEFEHFPSRIFEGTATMLTMTEKDLESFGEQVYPGIPQFFAQELGERGGKMFSDLRSLGSRELENAKNFPKHFADTILWLIGI